MKNFISFLFTFFLCGLLAAQSDTTKVVQEAPDNLQLLLDRITEEETNKNNGYSLLEIDGLLIDETKTKSGRDFFELFYRDWEAPVEARNYSVLIEEKPFRMNQTLIEVSINETMIFQSFLQPRLELIEMLAEQSIATTQMYLIQYEELVRELEGEERSGSGIF